MTTVARKRTRLMALKIAETSGVDHPANAPQVGGEGWLVMKGDGSALDPETVEAILRAAKSGTACAQADCARWVLPGAMTCAAGHDQNAPDVTAGAPKSPAPKVHPQTAAALSTVDPRTWKEPAVSKVTKSAAFSAIERGAAELRATEPALTREQAIAKVTEQRPELAEMYRDAAPDVRLAKSAPAPRPGSAAADQLDALAASVAKPRGIPKHRAYDEVLASDEGRRLAAIYYGSTDNVRKARTFV